MARKRINRFTNRVSKAVGAGPLVDYAGAKIAKARLPKSQRKYVKDTTTKKQASKSAITLAANIAALSGGGAAIGAVGRARQAKKMYVTGRKIPKVIKIPGNKPIKVSNPGGNLQVSRRMRPVRFKIKKR